MVLPGILLVPLTILTFQGQTGVRARTDTVTQNGAIDLLAIPTLQVSMQERAWTAAVGTTSNAAYLDVFSTERNAAALTQALTGSFLYRWPKVTFTLSQTGQIGRQSLRLNGLTIGGAPPLPQPSSSGAPLPGTGGSTTANGVLLDELVSYGSLGTNVFVNETLSRDVTLGQFARATYTSGLGDDVELYPSQQVFGVGVTGQYRVSATHTVGLQSWADRIDTRGFIPTISIGLGGTWTHAFNARLSGFVSLGASYLFPEYTAQGTSNAFVSYNGLYPNVSLGLTMTRTPLTVSVSLIPIVDQISGQLDTRVTGTAAYTITKGLWTWVTSLTGATSVDDSGPDFAQFFGLTSLGYALSRELQLTTGAGASYQIAPYAQDDGSALFFGQVGLNFTPRGLKL